MGLDITAYRNIRPASPEVLARINASEEPRELAYDLGLHIPYINSHFPGREEGIAPGMAYAADDEVVTWCASYPGYNRWRRNLAALVGISDLDLWWKDPQPGPFMELICFADNEGVIGPVVSAKLAEDFKRWSNLAATFDPPGYDEPYLKDYWRQKFVGMAQCFIHAAQNGYVDFH